MQPVLSIIIVNTNSLDYLKKCLPTIYSGSIIDSFELIVVDNASNDGTDEFLKENYPDIKFFKSDVNLGFTRANNLGYRHSKGRYLLFLNGDTEIYGSALQVMINTFRRHGNAGIVGAQLLNSDGSLQISCVQAFPTIMGEALDFDFLRGIFPRSRLWGTQALYGAENDPVRVDVVSGACLMIRRDVFERVGQFDTSLFIFAEDVTLCYQARQAGWDVLYQKDALVLHHGGGSTSKKGQSAFSDVLKRESLMVFMKKHYSPLYATCFRSAVLGGSLIRLMALGVLLSLAPESRWWSSESRLKWKTILRWSLGFEKWAADLNQPSKMTAERWNYVRNLRAS